MALPGSEPKLRVKIDGKVENDAEVTTTGSGDSSTAVVSCACKLPTGEHVVALEGAVDSGTTRVGARTLYVFDEVSFKGTSGSAVAASDLVTDEARSTPRAPSSPRRPRATAAARRS